MSDYVFTVMAYKPDRTDYCRGCEMGRHPSDFKWQSFCDENEAIEFMAQHAEDYDVTLLLDGDEYPDDSIGYEKASEMRQKCACRAKAIEAERVVQRKARQTQKEEEYRREKEESEKRTLADLQKKYGAQR